MTMNILRLAAAATVLGLGLLIVLLKRRDACARSPVPWERPDMNRQFPLFPEAASTVASEVDLLFVVWSVISVFFTVLIAGLILYFMARYRRRHADEVGQRRARGHVARDRLVGHPPRSSCWCMFVWGTQVFFNIYRPPADAVRYSGVGKQWMWKFQHPDGPARDQHAARAGGPADPADHDSPRTSSTASSCRPSG